MSDKEVAKFMVGMSLDPMALQRFHQDPDRELRRFGIGVDAAKVIKSRDATRIHKAITENFGAASDTDVVNVVVVVL